MKSFAKVCLILVTAVTMASYTARAQTDSTSPSTNAPAAKPKSKSLRFTGKITSVDNDAKTITIATPTGVTHVLHITSDTKFKKDGEPAVLADATVGEKVRGSYRKNDSGDWVARTMNIGEPQQKAAPPASAAPGAADKQ